MGWFDERFIESSTRLRFDCVSCSRPMFFPISKHGKYKTCGGSCAERKIEADKSRRTTNCATCGREFTPRGTQLRVGHGTVCSQKCNVKVHALMNRAESQARAKASWKIKHAKSPIVKSGAGNPSWKGGPTAAIQRRIASGKRSPYWANRVLAGGGVRPQRSTIKKLGDNQRWKCVVCKQKLVKYEVDHIYPLSLGGGNESSNLQLLCVRCNRRKSAKNPIDFMQSMGYLL